MSVNVNHHKLGDVEIPLSAEGLSFETLKTLDSNIIGLYFEKPSGGKVLAILKSGYFVAPEGGWNGKKFITVCHEASKKKTSAAEEPELDAERLIMEHRQIQLMLPMIKNKKTDLEAIAVDLFNAVKHHKTKLKDPVWLKKTYPVLAEEEMFQLFLHSIKIGKAVEKAMAACDSS